MRLDDLLDALIDAAAARRRDPAGVGPTVRPPAPAAGAGLPGGATGPGPLAQALAGLASGTGALAGGIASGVGKAVSGAISGAGGVLAGAAGATGGLAGGLLAGLARLTQGASAFLNRGAGGAAAPAAKAAAPDGKGLAGVGEALRGLASGASAATLAFGTLGGAVTALAAAGGPALSGTLTKSVQLFGASVAQAAVGPVLTLAGRLQDAAHWFQRLDDATKENIGKWVTWGGAVSGAGVALSTIAGVARSISPALGGLVGPVGLLAGGLALLASQSPGALAPLAGAARGAMTQLEPLAARAADLARAVLPGLAAAAQGLAGAAGILSQGLALLTGFLGPAGVQAAAAGAALAAFGGQAKGAIGIVALLGASTGRLGPALGAVAGGIAGVTAATRLMSAAFAATPLGGFLVGVTAITGAVMGLRGAFDELRPSVAQAAAGIEKMKTSIREMQEGKKPLAADAAEAMLPEEREAFGKAATPAERHKVLEDVQARLERSRQGWGPLGTATFEQLERGRVAVSGLLGNRMAAGEIPEAAWEELRRRLGGELPAGARGEASFLNPFGKAQDARSIARQAQIRQALQGIGISEQDALAATSSITRHKESRAALEKETLTGEDVKNVLDALIAGPLKNVKDAQAIKSALAQGVDLGEGEELSPLQRKRRELERQRTKTAANKEMAPTVNTDFTAGFKAILVANQGKDALDKEILAVERAIYAEMVKLNQKKPPGPDFDRPVR